MRLPMAPSCGLLLALCGGLCIAPFSGAFTGVPLLASRATATATASSSSSPLRMTITESELRVQTIQVFTGKVLEGIRKAAATSPVYAGMEGFLKDYGESGVQSGVPAAEFVRNVEYLMKFVPEVMANPFEFGLFHSAVRKPIDMYEWGNSFVSVMLEKENSKVVGLENLALIKEYLDKGENVFFLSNHQTEADPQVLSLLFEREGYGEMGAQLINVAGHRVTTDPLAIPFSMGRNLFCIYSKKYMEDPPEQKPEKQKHNVRTLKTMADMLNSPQGQLIWVAPSGGRDRPDPVTNSFIVAPFDPKSVDIFRLMAKKAKDSKTHFFPMAMWTNKLIPPPATVNKQLGEARSAKRGPASIAIGAEILGDGVDRVEFTATVENAVKDAYSELDAWHASQ